MPTLYEFSTQITQCNQAKDYNAALQHFREHYKEYTYDEIQTNTFVISSILTALRHSKCELWFRKSIKFLNFYKVLMNEHTHQRILNAYGWILFSKLKENALGTSEDTEEFKDNYYDEEHVGDEEHSQLEKNDLRENVLSFIPLIKNQNDEYSLTLLSQLFAQVIKTEKSKPHISWQFIDSFCDMFNPNQLQQDCFKGEVEIKGRMQSKEFASVRETWYSVKTKALFKQNKYAECFSLSKKALESFSRFHYSNDIWFARRIALSRIKTGNAVDAIADLHDILLKKREWFIQKEISELYFKIGETEIAFNYAIQAINNYGDLEYKVGLLALLGEVLKKKNQNELAFKHFSLSYLIRVEQDWKIPASLSVSLKEFNKENIAINKINELKRELQTFWKESVRKDQLSGRIDHILHDNERGVVGYIRYDDQKQIYFSVNRTNMIADKLIVGVPVEFIILPAIEGKKERASHLRLIQK